MKKYNKPLLLKGETKIFKQKIFYKKLVQCHRENNSGVFFNDKQMFAVKLLANLDYV